MSERQFAPRDQYQPFVDEFGRVTPEWYSWLKLLCDELNRLREIEAEAVKVRSIPSGPPYDYGGVDG